MDSHSHHIADDGLLAVRCEPDRAHSFHCDALADSFAGARELSLPRGDVAPDLADVDAAVFSGSTAGVYEDDTHEWISAGCTLVRDLLEREIPTLGVCFGHQLINHALGGEISAREFRAGLVTAEFTDDPLFAGVSPVVPALHGDFVVETGEGLDPIASVRDYEYPLFATRHREKPVWTVQFHPEIDHSHRGLLVDSYDWSEGDHSFSAVNARRVFENFQRLAMH